MKVLLTKKQGSSEYLKTLSWQLNNSKRCPNCSVMITRDEGCNKVECLLCGHKFCWFENFNLGNAWDNLKAGNADFIDVRLLEQLKINPKM
jgi:hypothetical protein